jgi:hypothetical protein
LSVKNSMDVSSSFPWRTSPASTIASYLYDIINKNHKSILNKCAHTHKDVCVYLHAQVNTYTHISAKITKYNKTMGIINMALKPTVVQKHTWISMYKTLTQSVLCHGSKMWTIRKGDSDWQPMKWSS